MKRSNIIEKLNDVALKLEIILTILLAIGIVIGLIDIIKYFYYIFEAGAVDSYSVFKQFLAHTLLIVIGIELMLMLISHSTSSMLELVLFVIARKMLIYGETMLDLVLGTLAIAILYVIIKFLLPKEDFVSRDQDKGIYSASTTVNKIIKDTGYDVPTDKGKTLGGLASLLAEENCVPVEEGAEFICDNLKLKILKATDGVIEKVSIKEIELEEDKKTQTSESNRD